MGKLDEKKKQKREALLSAAYDLFTSQGIFDTSISDIVKKAEMAKGTFYLYFKDKFDIRTALITEKAGKLFSVVREKMRDKREGSLEETVIRLVDIIIDELDADKRMLEFISKNLRWGIFHKVILEGGNEVSDSFYDWYNELIQSSGRTFRNHELMIYMIIELVSGVSYNAILFEQPESIEGIKPFLYETVRNIIHQFTAPA